MSHVVTGPLVIARTESGKQIYIYQGAGLPDDVPAAEVQRLVDTGLVEKQADPKKPGSKT